MLSDTCARLGKRLNVHPLPRAAWRPFLARNPSRYQGHRTHALVPNNECLLCVFVCCVLCGVCLRAACCVLLRALLSTPHEAIVLYCYCVCGAVNGAVSPTLLSISPRERRHVSLSGLACAVCDAAGEESAGKSAEAEAEAEARAITIAARAAEHAALSIGVGPFDGLLQACIGQWLALIDDCCGRHPQASGMLF